MASAPPPTNLEGEDVRERRPTFPEDGYEWKKYGNKFVKTIRKYRFSQDRDYFKCRNRRCKAKKKVEWLPSDPGSIKTINLGVHDHPCPRPQSNLEQEASARMANRFNLVNQLLGSSSETA